MNLTLRPWTLDDLKSLVRSADNPNIAAYLSDAFPQPYTEEAGRAFIESAMRGAPVNKFAIEVDGQAVGGIGIHPQTGINRKNAEIGYWLAEAFWGRGIATAAVTETVKFGFEAYDINRIFARIFGNNTGSQRVLEKAGFTLEARFEKTILKNGEYLDELIYAARR